MSNRITSGVKVFQRYGLKSSNVRNTVKTYSAYYPFLIPLMTASFSFLFIFFLFLLKDCDMFNNVIPFFILVLIFEIELAYFISFVGNTIITTTGKKRKGRKQKSLACNKRHYHLSKYSLYHSYAFTFYWFRSRFICRIVCNSLWIRISDY